MSDNREIAKQLRLEATYLRNLGMAISATNLEVQANKLDPKPQVSICHGTNTRVVVVKFDSKADATTISHFLLTVQNKADDVYKNEPEKQELIRAFIDAWHNREGK